MKKITLIIFMLISSTCFSQQQQYNLGFEPSTPSGNISNWISFEGPNPALSIVNNPTPNGSNTSATTKVMKVDLVQGSACYAGLINTHGAFGTWRFDTSIPSNATVSVQVNKSFTGKVGIKFVTPGNGTVIESTTNEGLVSTVNQWITYTWNISSLNTAEQASPNSNDQFVFFVDFTCGGPDRSTGGTILFDNVTWNANKITDPALPTCTDGIQNGTETGIDCGGTCAPCPAQEPLIAAPTPPVRLASDVVSIFSNAYNNVNLSQLPADFSQQATFAPVQIGLNDTWKVTGCEFLALVTNYETGINLSSMEKFHIDYWTPNAIPISLKIVNTVNSPVTEGIAQFGPVVTGSWKSVDLDMSAFVGNLTDKTKITQILIDPISPSVLFIDNFYFYKASLANRNFEALKIQMYPNPANSNLTINSKEAIDKISICNLLGQEVISRTPNNVSVSLDISNLQIGVYVVKATVNGIEATSRMIKK